MRRSEFLTAFAATVSFQRARRRLNIVAAPLGHDIDPYRDTERGVDELSWLYADGLMGIEGRPLLAAAEPETAHGGRTYRYVLRQASWHDGRPFGARDVAAAFRSVSGSVWGTHEPYRSVRAVDVLDDRRFDVRLDSPREHFVRSFFAPYGVPALPLVRPGMDGLPLGTGPYAVAGRPELDRWTLHRWDRSPRGRPGIDEIGLRIINFAPTRATQMQTGEADIAIPLAPDALLGTYETYRRMTSTTVLIFNTKRIFRDPAARRACAAVVDVPALQQRYRRTSAEIFASMLMTGPSDESWKRTLQPDRAAQPSLRSAVGASRVVLAYVAGSPAHDRTMTLLQQNLGAAGVESELRPVEPARYLTTDGPLRSGAFDLAIVGYANLDGSDLAADWSCANVPPRGGNFGRWCDDATERALARGDVAAVLRRLYDEMACLPLAVAVESIAVSSKVGGFSAPAALVPATYDCAEWRWR